MREPTTGGGMRGPYGPVTLMTLVFQMTVGVGVLVVLLATQAVITLWNSGVWGARSLKNGMTPLGRYSVSAKGSWRKAIYLFYLGTVASWACPQPADAARISPGGFDVGPLPGAGSLPSQMPLQPLIAGGAVGTSNGAGKFESSRGDREGAELVAAALNPSFLEETPGAGVLVAVESR